MQMSIWRLPYANFVPSRGCSGEIPQSMGAPRTKYHDEYIKQLKHTNVCRHCRRLIIAPIPNSCHCVENGISSVVYSCRLTWRISQRMLNGSRWMVYVSWNLIGCYFWTYVLPSWIHEENVPWSSDGYLYIQLGLFRLSLPELSLLTLTIHYWECKEWQLW